MKSSIVLAFVLFLALHVDAQQTGSFSLNIAFDEPDYAMSNEPAFYVPTDYDAGIDYPLIVGFRGGPHTGSDHLRDQLQPLSDSLGAIILCPESVSLWQNSQ
jgi:predicted peptidase